MAKKVEIAFVLSVVELVLKYGVPAAIRIIATLRDDSEITIEKINKLKNLTPPEEFFPGLTVD